MISYISIYLFPDTITFLQKDNNLIAKIEKDTHTTLKIVAKKYDPSVTIEGQFEDVHEVRIILQPYLLELNNSLSKTFLLKKYTVIHLFHKIIE